MVSGVGVREGGEDGVGVEGSNGCSSVAVASENLGELTHDSQSNVRNALKPHTFVLGSFATSDCFCGKRYC